MSTFIMSDISQDNLKRGPDSKKRKRNRKAQPDRKFECHHEGCDKSYSRAEHLHRHQLNRTLRFKASPSGKKKKKEKEKGSSY